MKNAIFWDGTPCGSCKKRHRWLCRLLGMAKIIPSSPILVTLMMEAICSSETSFIKWATRRNLLEGGILHSHRRKNLKFYIRLTGWTL
jgi:hypothetical protein